MNIVTIQRTVFVDHNDQTKTFGYRMYDDNDQIYCNTLNESDLELDDEKFLRHISVGFDERAESMFDFALEHGLYIDYKSYEFDLSGDTWEFKK